MSTVPDTLLEGLDRSRPLGAPLIRSAELIRDAIESCGIGERWHITDDRLPEAVRVGNRLIVVENDIDECGRPAGLGWLLTVYAVRGDEAVPVGLYVTETKNAARHRLVCLLRQAVRPLVWTRQTPGLYRAGRYLVGHLDATGEWFAEGPGVDQVYDSKAAAQSACEAAARR